MNTLLQRHPIEILLVEDSPTDRLIAVEALRKAKVMNTLTVVENGVEAMAYLRQEGRYAMARRPDMILLDLNLPKKDGREVLKEIKFDPALKSIPVVVLTTSKAEEDLIKAYGNYANSYITKPVDFPSFIEIINSFENYWFEVVTLPPPLALQNHHAAASHALAPPLLEDSPILEVLLAEDNPTDVLLIKHALSLSKQSKFNITHVERLSDLHLQMQSKAFHILLVDLGLPDSHGLETYRQARAFAAGLPIIVLTGLDDETTGISTLREGAQEYLVKGRLSEHSLSRAIYYAIEKKNIEERLRQAQKMEALGQLAAGVAHDFNNILTVIRGRAGLLLLKEENSFITESAQEIQSAVDRAAHLTRQLLTFSRQQFMQTKPLNLNEALGEIFKMLARIVGEDIHIDLRLNPDSPLVEADLGMIEQVILNLAVNARDAMPDGGKLSIATTTIQLSPEESKSYPEGYAGRFVCLSVADTGCGIPVEVTKHIFEPFFTTKEIGKGTGLGLATVFTIVQQHRGWIDVRSEQGKGSIFDIFLPVSTLQPCLVTSDPVAESSTGTETILLVEDEEAVLSLARTILTMQGYRVIEARTAAEAISQWQENGFEIDLLLTDLIMPGGKTGIQLVKELREKNPNLKVLLTSGYEKDFRQNDPDSNQNLTLLHKPYEIADLLRMVRQCLHQPGSVSPREML
jgi:two-component system, cell cycle sensor histidine kinase and response regulator CckA